MIPERLKKGDTIGIIAPSDPISEKNKAELLEAKEKMEKEGFIIKFSRHLFSNINQYSATAQEKAEDLNAMFADQEVKMIWCAKGGENSNSTFDYLDYELIRQNPKIFCGYSDITSLSNAIYSQTGLVTFHGTNFKTTVTDETDWSYQEIRKRLVQGSLEIGDSQDQYQTIQEGVAEGILVGGNLSLVRAMTTGKYQIDFQDKILFLEEFGLETDPALANNFLYFMKQNGVFEKIKGLWIGYYEHESGISLEKIILDVIRQEYNFPIIKSNNFGHTEKKTVIPIGTKAKIDTTKQKKIELTEKCIK